MTDEPTAPSFPAINRNFWSLARNIVLLAAVFSVLYNPLSWLTGGLRSQLQIDLEAQKKTIAEQQSAIAVLSSRLDNLQATIPRSSDVAGWEAHLSRLDAVYDALRDSQAQDRLTNKETAIRVQSLTVLPAPNKR